MTQRILTAALLLCAALNETAGKSLDRYYESTITTTPTEAYIEQSVDLPVVRPVYGGTVILVWHMRGSGPTR